MTIRLFVAWVIAGVMLLPLNAQEEKAKASEAYLVGKTPVASALLMKAYRDMGNLKRFTIDAVTMNDDVYPSWENGNDFVVTYTHRVHIDVVRPYRLRIRTRGDVKNKDYYLNKGFFTVYDLDTGYYGQMRTPAKIDAALDFLFEKFRVKTVLANVLYSDLYRRIPPKNKGIYLGLSEVDGVTCHHLVFLSDTHEYQVWVEKGDKALIRQFVIVDKTDPSLPRSIGCLQWKTDATNDESVFEFVPADGAVKIDIEPKANE